MPQAIGLNKDMVIKMSSVNRNFTSALKFALGLILAWGIFLLIVIAAGPENTLSVRTVSKGTEFITDQGPQFTLPSGFSAEPESFEGNEIEYHLNLKRSDGLIYGYFEIIYVGTELSSQNGLEQYVKNTGRYKSASINSFIQDTASMGKLPAITWEYTISAEPPSNGLQGNSVPTEAVKAMQGFASKKERLYTLALFTNSQKVSMEEIKETFQSLMSSFIF